MSDRTVSILRSRDNRLIPAAGVYEIDGAHTSVEFVARHLMITKVRGRFNEVRGRLTIAEEPEDSHVEAEIGTGSLSTRHDDRDAHLRSGDFFDVEHYPTIAFRSTSVPPLSDGSWRVVGDLSVRDTTRSVALHVVDREDFGLTANTTLETGGLLVGKTAGIELNVEAVATTEPAVA
jgi:polyisoprenoid-binding protein YceI